jgi:hypothetical protein
VEGNPYQSSNAVTEDSIEREGSPPANAWKWAIAAAIIAIVFWCIPLLNFPPLIFLGWATSRAWPSHSRVIARLLAIAAGACLGILLLSGLLIVNGVHNEIHHWAGHGIVMLIYPSSAFSLGVLLQQKLQRRPVAAIAQSFALLFCLALTLSTSFTGYLDVEPSSDSRIAQETHNRFMVLHLVLQPAIIAAMLAVWHLSFRSHRIIVQPSQPRYRGTGNVVPPGGGSGS